MCCIDVIIIDENINNCAPDHLKGGNGLVIFSVPLRMSKKREQLSVLSGITREGALGFSVDYSDLSNFLFAGNFDLRKQDNNYDVIPVKVMAGFKQLPFDHLCIIGRSDKKKAYDIELIQLDVHWKESAQACRLCDLPKDVYGDFTYNSQSFAEHWAAGDQHALYEDGGLGYFFAAVDFGGVDPVSGIPLNSQRPLFHLLPLARALFCKIGWRFVSPVWETEMGRRQVAQLTDDLGSLPTPDKFGFEIGLSADTPVVESTRSGDIIAFDTIIRNDGDFVTQTGSGELFAHNMNGEVTICMHIEIVGEINGVDSVPFRIGMVGNQQPGPPIVPLVNFSRIYTFVQAEAPLIIDFEVTLTELVNSTFLFRIRSEGVASTLIVGANSYAKTKVRSVDIEYNIEYCINNFLSYEYSLFDLFEGMIHDVSGFLVTDYNTKTIYLYSPEDTDVFGEQIKGFFDDNEDAQTLEGIECDSLKEKTPKGGNNRYCVLGYAEPQDSYVKARGYGKLNPLYGRVFDLENSSGDGVDYKLNPFFEATAVRDVPSETGTPVALPVMWDNDDGENISKNIAPRQLTAVGMVQIPMIDENENDVLAEWVFSVEQAGGATVVLTSNDIPYAAHIPREDAVFAADMSPIPVIYNVYGDRPQDQYNLFWKTEIDRILFGRLQEYLVYIDAAFYCGLDFRGKFKIKYNGVEFFARIAEIKDFAICEKISTPVTIEPDLNRTC